MTSAILKTSFRRLPVLVVGILWCVPLWSQADSSGPVARTYPYALEVVRKGLEQIGGFGGGKLPLIDGFVPASVPQIDRYERPYYQYRVQLNPADSGSTTVRVEARITAWYADPEPASAQYRSLPSNGRLETDLLDRLQDTLGVKTGRPATLAPGLKPPAVLLPADNSARPDSVTPRTKPADPAAKPSSAPASPQEQLDALLAQRQDVREKTAALVAQMDIQKAADSKSGDVARLASVRHSGVGVMSRKNFGGPVLFRAQAEDEFDVESLESGWALVRLSEGTTAYIQADELNMPAGIVEKPAVATTAPSAPQSPAKTSEPDLGFWVSREDVNVFSGDWARLKGKKVLFVYAQPRGILSDMAGDDAKLAYTKRVFMSRFRSVTQSAAGVEGVVVVFLGSKGGVAAATLTDIQQWVEGGLGDEAFVNRCSLDPPDEFRRIHLK